MIGALMGLPGKCKAIYDHLTSYLPSTVNTRMDATLSSRALVSDGWSSTLATSLDGLAPLITGKASETTPALDIPIASGSVEQSYSLGNTFNAAGIPRASKTSTSLSDVVNYTGQGVLEFVAIMSAGAGNGARVIVTIDGAVFADTTVSGQYVVRCPVGTVTGYNVVFSRIPFKTSLQIQYSSVTLAQSVYCHYKYHKTG